MSNHNDSPNNNQDLYDFDWLEAAKVCAWFTSQHNEPEYQEYNQKRRMVLRGIYRKRQARYRRNHPERIKVRSMNQRTGGEKGRAAYIKELHAIQEGRCGYCGITLHGVYHVDHIIPLARAGTNADGNLILSCPKCNFSKNDALLAEWYIRRGW